MSVQKVKHEDVLKIREMDKKREFYRQKADEYKIENIAKKFNVSPTTIYAICNGIAYARVKSPN